MSRIVVTGATGNLGGKVAAHLAGAGHDLMLLDRRAAPGIVAVDLGSYDAAWTDSIAGADAIVHFAGEGRPKASWDDAHAGNVLMTGNVLRAARAHGVGRVVYASTNQVMGGYRFRPEAIRPDSPPAPLNPYAVSKLICEEMGRAFAAETGAGFVAFRIGNIPPGDNIPGPDLGIGTWGQEMWLSNRDLLQAVDRALAADIAGFVLLNLVSANPGMRWEIETARAAIGYVPQDGHAAVRTAQIDAEEARARLSRLVPGAWLDQFGEPLEG